MLWFSSKEIKNILILSVAEKNILILVEEKKLSDSEFLSYNLMLNSGNKFSASCDNKINILTLVLSEKKILNETKNHNHNPPSS